MGPGGFLTPGPVERTNINKLKEAISVGLRRIGFSDVGISELDVAGNKGACRVSIGHFRIADPRFWEIVMCSCDGYDAETARRTVNKVVTMLGTLRV